MREMEKRFRLTERLNSFRYAFNGIYDLLRYGHNFRIHLVILIAVIPAGVILKISSTEWMAIVFVSALVLVSESLNTSLEHLSDAVSGESDERIRRAKDVAAAAVLISALAALITGLMIFVPELIELFSGIF
jgi:diacylglycerol kinase (ATP)